MKTLRTTSCSHQGHPEFCITYDPNVVVVPDDAIWFLKGLEESVAGGARYKPGETIQVGWAIAVVRQEEEGDLTLWESDMQSMPIQWVAGLSSTLAQLRTQKDVVESVVGANDLSFPSMRQSALICSRFGHGEGLILDRFEPTGAASGWYFGCRDNDHDHNDAAELRCVSLYEAALHTPQIISYLALPPGVLVGLRGGGVPSIFLNGEPLVFKPGSYLAALAAAGK